MYFRDSGPTTKKLIQLLVSPDRHHDVAGNDAPEEEIKIRQGEASVDGG